MITPGVVAERFSAYCIAISAVPDMERLATLCERMMLDRVLTDNQKDALEALAVARERILNWDSKGLT